MKRISRASSLLAIIAGVVSQSIAGAQVPPASSSRADSILEHTIAASPGDTLTLDLATGGSVMVRGWNEKSVRLRARLGGRDWRDTRVEFAAHPNGVRLLTALGGSRTRTSTSHEFEIWVPLDYSIELESGGGSLGITHVAGTFRGQTAGGSIVLDGVRGQVSLTTRGGDVRIADSDLEGFVTTRGGAVVLSGVKGSVQATSRIESTDPARDGVRRVDLRGGPIEIDNAPKGAVLHTGGGRISIARSGAAVDANTGSGDIDIGPTLGTVRAITGTGNINVSIARNLADSETVEIRSGTGTVTIVLPRDFDGAFDLMTGYTDSFGGVPRIESDWPLQLDQTAKSPNGGTPQRYIRGTGVAGRGGSRVVIRTTNGNIVVKRSP